MVVASGFVEANDAGEVDKVIVALKERGAEVSDVKEEKVVFLVEKESIGEVKDSVESFKHIDGVRSVYLAYYSLEDGGPGPADSGTGAVISA